jgi:hypothetical protein
MAKHTYRVASAEGAGFAMQQLGEVAELDQVVELDLDVNTKRAVVAAGWVEQLDVTNAAELEPLSAKQLDERFGELDGYPRSASKADKIAFITEGGN